MSFFQTKSAKIVMAVIAAVAVAVCALLILFVRRAPSETSSSEAVSEEAQSYTAVSGRVAYLTFDDGPSNCTPAVLSALKDADIKASFFVRYQTSATLQDYYADILAGGHLLGVKGHVGNDSVYSSASALINDLKQMMNDLEMLGIPQQTRYVRLPGGSNNAAVSEEIMQQVLLNLNRSNYLYYDWNVWADGEGGSATKDEIVAQIVSGVLSMEQPVILLHDCNDNDAMVEALPDLIRQLKEAGYSFDTVDHMTPPLHHTEYVEPDHTSEVVNSYDPIPTSSAQSYPQYTVEVSSAASRSSSSDEEDESGNSSEEESEDTGDSEDETSSADTSYEPEE